jgi:glycoside hydrolase-like protein
MASILDTNVDTTLHLTVLKAAGIKSVIRYLSPINPSGEKCIKPPEAHAIAAAELRLALVCEGWGDFAHGAISAGAGERDGEFCARYATTVGAPDNAAVYFAIDVDANAAQIKKLVLPYFASIDAAFKALAPNLRCGVYGSGAVCEAVMAAQLADFPWLSCSLGWSGSRAYFSSNKWALRQHVPATIAGIDCDPDDANGDFGDFAPFAPASPACA